MKTLVYYTSCLWAVCCLGISAHAASEFVTGSKIKVVTEENRALDGDNELAVFRKGTATGKPVAEKVKLKITNEFKPKPREEYKLSNPIYKWDSKEGPLTHDEKEEEEMEFTTTEKCWGKKFKVKGSIEYKDIPLDEKNKEELPNQEGPAKADIDVLTPVVKVKSVTFRHGKENSSLPVAEDAKGKLIPPPEYQADGGDKETAILYASESTPVIQVCFDVKPAELKMEDVEIKGEVGKGKESILKELTMEKTDNQNFDANSKIPFKAAKLEKKVTMGKVAHEFTITYKGIQLEKKPDYSIGKAYVVLGKPIGPWEKKTPWKDVLDFVLKECASIGCQDESAVLCAIKKKIKEGGYNPDKGIWFDGKSVLISNYLGGKLKIVNCLDAAVLTEVFSNTMGIKTTIHRCIPFSTYLYHSYNIWDGKIYDSLYTGKGGEGTLNEEEFYGKNGVRRIKLFQNKKFVRNWEIPFNYIKSQKEAKFRESLDDIPESEGIVYDCEPIVIYLMTQPEESYQIIE